MDAADNAEYDPVCEIKRGISDPERSWTVSGM